MTDKQKLVLKLNILLGRTSGVLIGLSYYNLPDKAKEVIDKLIVEIKEITSEELDKLND